MTPQFMKAFINQAVSFVDYRAMSPEDFQVLSALSLTLGSQAQEEPLSLSQFSTHLLYLFDHGSARLIAMLTALVNGHPDYRTEYLYTAELFKELHDVNLLNKRTMVALLALSTKDRIYFYAMLRMARYETIPLTEELITIFFKIIAHQTSPVLYLQERALTLRLNIQHFIPFLTRTCELPVYSMLFKTNLLNAERAGSVQFLEDYQFDYFDLLLQRLFAANRLTAQTFTKAYEYVTDAVVPAEPATNVAKVRRSGILSHSHLYFRDNNRVPIDLILEHFDYGNKRYHFSGLSKVKKAAAAGGQGFFAVKIYHACRATTNVGCLPVESFTKAEYLQLKDELYHNNERVNDINEQMESAGREAMINQLMGRPATYFSRNEKVYLITQWPQLERTLNHYTLEEVQAIPFQYRVACFMSGLQELTHLHSRRLFHGDIKSDNVTVSFEHFTMRLIDYDRAASNPVHNTYPLHRLFADGYSIYASYSNDIYAMGLIGDYLFPENNNGDDLIASMAIQKLLTRMTQNNPTDRCLAEHALDFCLHLLSMINRGPLEFEQVEYLEKYYLTERPLTDDCVLRGKLR